MRRLFHSVIILLLSCGLALGLEITQVTFEEEGLTNPVLAPGNKLIAYCQNQNGKDVLYSRPFSPEKGTRSGATKLYETYNKITEIRWSPTGTWLAFIERPSQNLSGTLTMITLNKKVEKLTDAVTLFNINSSGTQLIYEKGRDLYLYELRSAASRRLVSGDLLSTISSLHWRRDGTITYARKRLLGYTQLWSVDLTGRQSQLFSLHGHSTIAEHSWSADGQRLVYKDASSYLSSLWAADKNGENRQMLASGEVELAGWYGNDAFFFAKKDAKGRSQIWLAKLSSAPPTKPEPIKPEPPKVQPPRPLPGQEQIFYNNTFDGNQSWGSYPGARDRVKKGAYEIKLDRKNQGLKYIAPTTIPTADYTVEVELQNKKKEGKAGLIFNLMDHNNFHLFRIDPYNGTYSLLKQEGNRWFTLIRETKLSIISRKGTYKLTVRQSGWRLELYLNGHYLGEVSNRGRAGSKAGIWIASATKTPVEFAFDNFRILIPGGYVSPETKVLFSDNFSNSRSGWPVGTFQGTTANYRYGEYWLRINTPYSGYSYLAPTQVPTANYQLEVDLRFDSKSSGEAGVVFNVSTNNNFSLFTLIPQTQTWKVYKYEHGRKVIIAEGWANLKNNNQLKIVQENNILQVFLNNKLLTRKNHANSGNCQVGLMLASGATAPVDAYFDNFVVTSSDESTGFPSGGLFFSNLQNNFSPIFQLNMDLSPKLQAPASKVTVPFAGAGGLAGSSWYLKPKPKATWANFSVQLPLAGSLPLITEGGERSIYTTFEDDELDKYAFSGEQKNASEAKPSLLLPLTLSLPLNRNDLLGLSLAFSLRGFDNPILKSNEAAGGYLLNFSSGLNLSLALGNTIELFAGFGLGRSLINTKDKLATSGPWDEGFVDGDSVYPPGSTINLNGWSGFGGTTHWGVRFQLTPNLKLEGQYSTLPGSTISHYKYSLNSVLFSRAIQPQDSSSLSFPNPISIQGQSFLSAGLSVSF